MNESTAVEPEKSLGACLLGLGRLVPNKAPPWYTLRGSVFSHRKLPFCQVAPPKSGDRSASPTRLRSRPRDVSSPLVSAGDSTPTHMPLVGSCTFATILCPPPARLHRRHLPLHGMLRTHTCVQSRLVCITANYSFSDR